MKKKVVALSAALMLFTGVVSASSINGDYKGNPIVKVTSNGKQLETDEVPAQIYDGHTVVPISLLRQLGASVTWNADTYSVDVQLNNMQQTNSKISLDDIASDAINHNIGLVNYAASGKDKSSAITFFHNKAFSDKSIPNDDFVYVLSMCSQTDATRCRIYDKEGSTFEVDNQSVKSFYAGKMNKDELAKRYYFQQGVSSTPNIQPAPSSDASAIESQIDGEFNGWEGDTIFKLMNGQIWQQSSYDYTYHYAFMPNVVIYKSGTLYKMKVDGVDHDIYVKRIK